MVRAIIRLPKVTGTSMLTGAEPAAMFLKLSMSWLPWLWFGYTLKSLVRVTMPPCRHWQPSGLQAQTIL